ncbi:MAG: radical SAM family heme chaperone HemW [Actinomycetota bacterium]|nr:radical SAM family heme chaperone HemW [Actinomycetota bacterium]
MSDAVGTADSAALYRAAYVHIPFCHRRCLYCDFAVVDMAEEAAPIDRYLKAIVAEIEMEEPWGALHAVNFGGGTPSVLDAGQVGLVIDALSARFGLVEGAEVSIEANPEDWTEEFATSLASLGVNRVSLGVQSFDDAVLRSLGRRHTSDEGQRAVENARVAGVDTVNLDLIFGTAGETFRSWRQTVERGLALEPEHLSGYALTVERGTALSRAVRAGAPEPDSDDQADKYELLVELADAAGLGHYEISNWAKPGHECRYNMTTWAQGEYLAFGLGAHGHREQMRRRNVRRLDVYLKMLDEARRPEAGSEKLTAWERDKERVFLGLRRRSGVIAGDVGMVFLDGDGGKRFLDAGVVELEGKRLVVRKPLLTDAVLREVLALEQ